MTQKLTRRGARNVTEVFDRIATLVQNNADVLGLDPKIAMDFAKRADLLSDVIETTATINFPLKGVTAEFDATEVAQVVPGPLEQDADESYMATFDNGEVEAVSDKFASFNLFE